MDYVSILLATVLQFIVGAVWYMPIFGKMWGKIHDFEKHSKAQQEAMMKAMLPFYGVQIFMTLVTTVVLATFLSVLPTDWNPYAMTALFWLGFVVPTQASAVIFGGTPGKWIVTKLAIMAGGSLACLLVGTAVLVNI